MSEYSGVDMFTFRSVYFDYLPTERGSYSSLWLKADGPPPASLDVGATLTLELQHARAIAPYSEKRTAQYYADALNGVRVVVEEIVGERVRVSFPEHISVWGTFGLYTYGLATYAVPDYSARAMMRRPYAL